MTTKKLVTGFCAVSMIALLQTSAALADCKCSNQPASSFPQCSKQQQVEQQNVQQHAETSSNYWGVQAAIVDSGATSIGLVNYGECHSAGLTIAGFLKTTGKKSHVFTPGFFCGPRFKVRENTYFAFGVDVGARLGKEDGNSINSSIKVGPYVSIEYQPVRYVVLTAWINPYTYQNEKIGGKRTTTHKFAAGGIGISYLFRPN